MAQNRFFQNESKFVVGKCYEKIRVNDIFTFGRPVGTTDESGTIVPGSNVYVGEYIKSVNSGSNNFTRYDYFMLDGVENISRLDYDGTTRYREVDCNTRLPVIQLQQPPYPPQPLQPTVFGTNNYTSQSILSTPPRAPVSNNHPALPFPPPTWHQTAPGPWSATR